MTAIHPLARNVYFAWLGTETEAFDPVAHRRRDLPLRSWAFREEETLLGHSLSIVTHAMPVAALAGKLWCIVSFMMPDGTLVPQVRAKRRPVATTDAIGEMKLEFTVLPSDWESRQDAGLEPLKVAPFWVPNLVDPTRWSDPTEILDARRAIGHFDRVTQAYTTPELLGLGLPVKRLTARDLVGWKDGGGVRVRRTTQPLAGVQGEVVWEWTQADDIVIDASFALRQAYPGGNVGDRGFSGPDSSATVPQHVISTLTGEALVNGFPSKGGSVGGASGYEIIESDIKRIPAPAGAATVTGKVFGQKARYDFTSDSELKTPIGMKLDIEYYEGRLVLACSPRQKRRERIFFYIGNEGVAYADGKSEKVSARGYDPTVDASTPPYLQNELVAAGDQRRVGRYVWAAKRGHVTRGDFSNDLTAADGTEQWTLMPSNGSAAGTSNLASVAGTPLGQAAIVNVALRCMKKIAVSKRGNEVSFTVPLDRWPDVSTAWVGELDLGPEGERYFKGGVCRGKVVSVSIGRSSPKDFTKAEVTIACCDGSGAASPSPSQGVNPSGEVWDGISLSDSMHLPVPIGPQPFVNVIISNPPTDQLAYVQAHDFTGVAPRNDRTANDPKHLLNDVKAKVTLACAQIAGQPALTLDVSLAATAWHGPAQIQLQTV